MSVGGYLKTTNESVQPTAENSGTGLSSRNEQRFFLKGEPSGCLEYEFAVENEFLFSESPLDATRSIQSDAVNRRFDWTSTVRDEEYSRDLVSVDRMRVTWRGEDTEVKLGRQAVGFGRMALVSPLDVVHPFSPAALDTETRSGVDAIRAAHYFGVGGQLGGTVVLGDEDANNSYLLTSSYNTGGLDLLGIVGKLRSRNMMGAGLAGEINGLGLKGELVEYSGKKTTDTPGDLYGSFLIAGIEAWYRFDNGLELLAEYLYNGAGAGSPDGYAAAFSSAAMQEGLMSLAGQQYLLLRPSYEIHPLVTLEGLVIWNLQDQSALIRPECDISVSDNLELKLFWCVNTGASLHTTANPLIPSMPRSEFGSLNDYGGFSLKYYF